MAAGLPRRRSLALPGARHLSHPDPPWQLTGTALIVPGLVRAPAGGDGSSRAGAASAPPRPGGVLLARYESGSTLEYSELLGISGLRLPGGRPALWIPLARVDSGASISGGRAIWDIPKQPAAFRWSEDGDAVEAEVRYPDGGRLHVRAAAGGRRVGLPLLVPFTGVGGRSLGFARGVLHGRLARMRSDATAAGPLEAFGLAPVGLVGRVRVRVGSLRSPSGEPGPVLSFAGP